MRVQLPVNLHHLTADEGVSPIPMRGAPCSITGRGYSPGCTLLPATEIRRSRRVGITTSFAAVRALAQFMPFSFHLPDTTRA